jgi:hypothetical protein
LNGLQLEFTADPDHCCDCAIFNPYIDGVKINQLDLNGCNGVTQSVTISSEQATQIIAAREARGYETIGCCDLELELKCAHLDINYESCAGLFGEYTPSPEDPDYDQYDPEELYANCHPNIIKTLRVIKEAEIVNVTADFNADYQVINLCTPVPCEVQNTCWKLDFDLEFLSSAAWGMGNTDTWIPYTGNQTLWVDPNNTNNNRRTCVDGMIVDDFNPGPPGWSIAIPDAYAATGNVEAGSCLEGISLYMQSDFATTPGGFNMSPSEGVNTYSIEEDLSGLPENSGSSTQQVIRGTITVTRTNPYDSNSCGC